MVKEELLQAAFSAMKNAYAPYSNFHVGACLLCHDGRIFYGANIENASYGLTCCAERNAMFAAYSNGVRKDDIAALAIVCDGLEPAAPCGACRQVMVELLLPHTPIYLSNGKIERECDIAQLMPMSFSSEDLKHV